MKAKATHILWLLLLFGIGVSCRKSDTRPPRKGPVTRPTAGKRAAGPRRGPQKLPGWYRPKRLEQALAAAAGLRLTGIWSMRLSYQQGRDRLIYYLDVQARRGQLETVAVSETAPVPASRFVSADWRGRWVVVQPGRAHPRWPVDPLRDLGGLLPLLKVPGRLASLGRAEIKSTKPWQGGVLLEYEGYQLLLKQRGVAALVDRRAQVKYVIEHGPARMKIGRPGASVQLRSEGGAWRVESIAFEPAGLARGSARITDWRPAGTAAGVADPFREALVAYRQARRRGQGASQARSRVVALFGKWAEREIGGR